MRLTVPFANRWQNVVVKYLSFSMTSVAERSRGWFDEGTPHLANARSGFYRDIAGETFVRLPLIQRLSADSGAAM
jgi:hypothetical protein